MTLYYISDRIVPRLYSEYGYVRQLAYEISSRYGSDEKFKVMIFSQYNTAKRLQREFELESNKVAHGKTPKLISSMIYRHVKIPIRTFEENSIVHTFSSPSIKTLHKVKRVFEPISIKKYIAPHLFRSTEKLFSSIKDISRCNAVIAHNEYMSEQISSKLFIDNELIRIIPRAVDAKIDNGYISSIKLPEKYILFSGRIERYKNLERLVNAFTKTASKDLSIVFTGDSQDKAYFMKLKKFGEQLLGERITFTGYVDKKDLWYIMKNATLFCEPSYVNDFPESIIEAQALGTPVIASNIEPHKETCKETVLYFNPSCDESIQEMLSIVDDKKTLESLSKKGKSNSNLFKWDNIAPLYRDLYMSL